MKEWFISRIIAYVIRKGKMFACYLFESQQVCKWVRVVRTLHLNDFKPHLLHTSHSCFWLLWLSICIERHSFIMTRHFQENKTTVVSMINTLLKPVAGCHFIYIYTEMKIKSVICGMIRMTARLSLCVSHFS